MSPAVNRDRPEAVIEADRAAARGRMSEASPESIEVAINNIRGLRVGSLFLNDLDVLLRRLDDGEFKAFWKFRTEFVYGCCAGLPDVDKEMAQRLGYRKWPSLKQKLFTLGYLKEQDGKLFDPDVVESVKRQRKTSERQRERANKRWDREFRKGNPFAVAA